MLAKRFIDTKAMVGNSIRVPGANAGEEALRAFEVDLAAKVPGLVRLPTEPDKVLETLRGRGIVPKEATEYSLDGIHQPEGVKLTDDQVAALRKEALEEGLTKSAFRSRAQRAVDAVVAQTRAVEEGKTALRKEWGAAYDQRLADARGLLDKTNAPASIREAVAAGNIDKDTANWLVNLDKSLGNESRAVGEQHRSQGQTALTPLEAETQIAEILKNPVLKNRATNPQLYDHMLKEVARLEEFANPELAASERRNA